MEILKNVDGGTLCLSVSGRLDNTTAPELEAHKEALTGITSLILDFTNLEYVSSAGLRVLLTFQKIMNKQGSMTIKNVSPDVMEIIDITGFSDILTIE